MINFRFVLYYLSVPTILVPPDIPTEDEDDDPLNLSDELEIFKTPKPAKLQKTKKPKPASKRIAINGDSNPTKVLKRPDSSSFVTIPAQTGFANNLVPKRTILVNKLASPSVTTAKPSTSQTHPTIVTISNGATNKTKSVNGKDISPKAASTSKLVFGETSSERDRSSTDSESSVDFDDVDLDGVDVVVMPQTSTSTTLAGLIFEDRNNIGLEQKKLIFKRDILNIYREELKVLKLDQA